MTYDLRFYACLAGMALLIVAVTWFCARLGRNGGSTGAWEGATSTRYEGMTPLGETEALFGLDAKDGRELLKGTRYNDCASMDEVGRAAAASYLARIRRLEGGVTQERLCAKALCMDGAYPRCSPAALGEPRQMLGDGLDPRERRYLRYLEDAKERNDPASDRRRAVLGEPSPEPRCTIKGPSDKAMAAAAEIRRILAAGEPSPHADGEES